MCLNFNLLLYFSSCFFFSFFFFPVFLSSSSLLDFSSSFHLYSYQLNCRKKKDLLKFQHIKQNRNCKKKNVVVVFFLLFHPLLLHLVFELNFCSTFCIIILSSICFNNLSLIYFKRLLFYFFLCLLYYFVFVFQSNCIKQLIVLQKKSRNN